MGLSGIGGEVKILKSEIEELREKLGNIQGNISELTDKSQFNTDWATGLHKETHEI